MFPFSVSGSPKAAGLVHAFPVLPTYTATRRDTQTLSSKAWYLSFRPEPGPVFLSSASGSGHVLSAGHFWLTFWPVHVLWDLVVLLDSILVQSLLSPHSGQA